MKCMSFTLMLHCLCPGDMTELLNNLSGNIFAVNFKLLAILQKYDLIKALLSFQIALNDDEI